jgi:hypothetical protein
VDCRCNKTGANVPSLSPLTSKRKVNWDYLRYRLHRLNIGVMLKKMGATEPPFTINI